MLYFEVATWGLVFVCVLLYFKTRSPCVGQGGLELSTLSLPSTEVTGVHHHVRLVSFGGGGNSGFCVLEIHEGCLLTTAIMNCYWPLVVPSTNTAEK